MKKTASPKRLISLLIPIVLLAALYGCNNYRGLDQMAIVTGMAVDTRGEMSGFRTTFEIIDMTKPIKEKGLTTIIIESEGETLFDAVRNAKKQVRSKLYLGHMKTVIIGREAAEKQLLPHITDWFLRDTECRETIRFIISQEKTAADILKIKNEESAAISYELESILGEDNKVTCSTYSLELYQVFGVIYSKGQSLTLPAVRIIPGNGMPRNEINGIAVFKDNAPIGYLSPEETKYFLFIMNKIEGGLLTVRIPDGAVGSETLEIVKSKTSRSYKLNKDQINITIKTKTEVHLDEAGKEQDFLDENIIKKIEKAANKNLENKIMEVIKKVQDEFGSDIFGFGKMISKKYPKQWEKLESDWDDNFKKITFKVISKVEIKNTSLLKKYGSE